MVFFCVPKKFNREGWLSRKSFRLTYNNKIVKYLYEIEKVKIGKDIVIDHLTTNETLKKIESDLLKNIDRNVFVIDLPEWLETERDICFENYNYRKNEEEELSCDGL